MYLYVYIYMYISLLLLFICLLTNDSNYFPSDLIIDLPDSTLSRSPSFRSSSTGQFRFTTVNYLGGISYSTTHIPELFYEINEIGIKSTRWHSPKFSSSTKKRKMFLFLSFSFFRFFFYPKTACFIRSFLFGQIVSLRLLVSYFDSL